MLRIVQDGLNEIINELGLGGGGVRRRGASSKMPHVMAVLKIDRTES